ncbi:flagellar hook-associated protein 2 [Oceanisphaera profunda]|uniref:Flagellar hook-associated protein 2 n=1 Tax=Oceanisphaera profunda TaxID=1416627 RepID=A0A1Y0D750_9GAMM|nr:flagellar filament capping protein FliD [Oceanisphaera profunda]ART83369.1 flagellar hook-associated protein 2 [Oceanisphaera profunda]
MGDLKLPGVGSGFPIQTFVDATVNAEKAPKEALFNRRGTDINVKLSSYASLGVVLDDFKKSLTKLGGAEAFQKRSVSFSESGFISAKADQNAVAGSYTLVVDKLAQAHKVSSQSIDKETKLGAGSLDIKVGEQSFTVAIEEGKSTLAEVAQAINSAEGNKGVKATVVNDDEGARLVLFSEKTGTDHQLEIDVRGDADGLSRLLDTEGNLTEVQAAQNAEITIDGAKVTSQSNEIKDAVNGVTLTVDKVNTEEKPSTRLTIGYDKGAVESNVKSFVEAFNKVVSTVNKLTKYDAETKQAGPLNGDTSTRSLMSQLRRMLSEPVEGAQAPLQNLADLGVTTNKDGTIALDETRLKKQTSDNFEKVGALFASDKGLSKQLSTMVDEFGGKNGIFSQRTESLNGQMTKLGKEKESFSTYIEQYEKRVYKQFSAMDIVVAQMNQQLSSVISAFENMPTFGNKK